MRVFLFCAFILALAVPAAAEDKKPFTIDFNTVLKDFDGTALTYPVCLKSDDKDPRQCAAGAVQSKDMTLSYVAINSLTMPEPNEDGVEQIRRNVLASEISKKGSVALTGKDIELLDRLIPKWVAARSFLTVVTFQALTIIDPAFVEKSAGAPSQ